MSEPEDVMELLMPLTLDEVLEERRKTASRKAVVVESERAAAALRQVVEEGVQILLPGNKAGQGQRFDLIIMAMKPGPMEMRWFEEVVMTALRPGGKIEWVTPRLSLA